MKIKFGIVGCGRISHKFAEAVDSVENAVLVSVSASKKEKADEFAKLFDVKNAYGSYDELIFDNEIDIIYIGLTNNFHYEIAKKCIENGKNVLCEKPLTLTFEETTDLCDLAKTNNVFFMEAMWTRCLPAFQKAKSWVRDGKIGKTTLINADFCLFFPFNKSDRVYNLELGGGALYDLGVYPIGFVTGIMDKKPLKTQSIGHIGVSGVDEYSVITMKFDDDTIGILKTAINVSKPVEATIHGENGYILLKDFSSARDCFLYDNKNNLIESFHDDVENGFIHEIIHTTQMLLTNKKESTLMPLEDTIYCAKLISDCLKEWKT